MKLIGRSLGFLVSAFMLASLVGAVAAAIARRRLPRVDTADADEIHLSAVFEPLAFESTATAFHGGTIDTWYGGGIVDLRKAVLEQHGARLTVRALFGGAQIVVPDEWRVISEVRGLGGIGDERPQRERPYDAPTLVIGGIALFGGFGITSSLDEGAMKSLREAAARRHRRDRQPDSSAAASVGGPASLPVATA